MHGEERDSRILRGTGGNKRRVSFITALTKDKLNNKQDQLENLRTIFHISELFKCWERGWTAVFENFGTQPLCKIAMKYMIYVSTQAVCQMDMNDYCYIIIPLTVSREASSILNN